MLGTQHKLTGALANNIINCLSIWHPVIPNFFLDKHPVHIGSKGDFSMLLGPWEIRFRPGQFLNEANRFGVIHVCWPQISEDRRP